MGVFATADNWSFVILGVGVSLSTIVGVLAIMTFTNWYQNKKRQQAYKQNLYIGLMAQTRQIILLSNQIIKIKSNRTKSIPAELEVRFYADMRKLFSLGSRIWLLNNRAILPLLDDIITSTTNLFSISISNLDNTSSGDDLEKEKLSQIAKLDKSLREFSNQARHDVGGNFSTVKDIALTP